jgi:outer membrane protein OmpA-like peptidoglycan-associated protein
MNNNLSVHENQASYGLWTWLIALLLAIILLWMLFTGRGPSSSCCAAPTAAVPAEVLPAAPIAAAESFGFTANCKEFSNTGDATAHAWVANSESLKTMLCGGEELKASGDGKNVVLTGVVDSEATKTKMGEDAQVYFGADVAVDNQITVKAAEPVAMAAPPAAKLYFDTAKINQPADSAATLAPILEWLKANPNAKAVISGFHDPRGSAARNEQLAKGRAQSTYEALIAAGVDASRIEMRKPADINGGGDLNEARRVEVSVE